MGQLSRATRGGVGAVVIALAVTALALTAGWVSAAAYDALRGGPCVGQCAAEVQAESRAPTATPTDTPEPTPTLPAGFPFVSARSIAIVEGGCGAMIYGRDEHLRLPPASLTKMMTAAIAVERADLDMTITARVDSAKLADDTGSTIMGLVPGMQLTLRDLLYGLLLPSGNDAAITIAEGVAGSEEQFVDLMNQKAESLALKDTHFTNPHGLDAPDLRSSAYDMAMLARYMMQNADLREIVRSQSWQPAWDGPPVWNGNRLIGEYDGADGVKIGYTEESQQTIVASATRGGRRIIASLMRSQDRYADAEHLLDWAFDQPSACP